jgi:hypothetical protein
VLFCRNAEVVENHAWLNPSEAAGGINLENPRHVFREIKNDGRIAALTS